MICLLESPPLTPEGVFFVFSEERSCQHLPILPGSTPLQQPFPPPGLCHASVLDAEVGGPVFDIDGCFNPTISQNLLIFSILFISISSPTWNLSQNLPSFNNHLWVVFVGSQSWWKPFLPGQLQQSPVWGFRQSWDMSGIPQTEFLPAFYPSPPANSQYENSNLWSALPADVLLDSTLEIFTRHLKHHRPFLACAHPDVSLDL